jgi:DNA-binding response OmpR family regulator
MPPTAELHPTVLVADDDELVRFAVRSALEADGCIVIQASSGKDAARLAAANQVTAIILDAHMPGGTLAETLGALRASPSTAHVAIIILSGAPVELGEYESFVLAVLRKPVALESLRTVIRAVAANHTSVRAPGW